MKSLTDQQTHERRDEEGFSLIELMVALVVTGIVTGAMFGLLTGGQNAFRREPELADRQQAVRISMDRIQRDVQAAGGSMGLFSQVFTDLLDAQNGTVPAPDPAVPIDHLEFLTHSGECPDVMVSGVTGTQLDTASDIPACLPENALLLIEYQPSGATKPGWAHMVQSGGGMFIDFPQGQQPGKSELGQFVMVNLECGDPVFVQNATACMDPGATPFRVLQLEMVRYEIAPDPTDGMPSLWRSGSGGIDGNGDYQPPPDPAGGWRLIARGIEDMQIQYFTQSGGWADTPGVPDFATQDNTTVVERVKITLQARTTATNLAGTTTSVAGTDAVRGQLTTVMAPRAILHNLAGQTWH